MNDKLHPNHPDYVRHNATTGEVDEDVTIEVMDPINVGALATLQRVEIDQQVATAKMYPRNVTMIRKELTALVTMDEDTADDCIYALPRGKKHIKGPSARFADALISFWGNARSGAFITQVNREEKFVEAIGSFQDVERNVIRQRRVRRPIVTAQGALYNLDMINMTGNAACVIAERNAILNGIPKSLWSGAYEQAFALVAGTTKTLGEKLERATKAFMLHGISMEQVLEKIGHQDISKVIPDDIVTMRGMLTALKTGEETIETIFGRGAGAPAHDVIKNPLRDDPSISTGGPRGNTEAMSRADKVVDSNGKVLKDREGSAGGDHQDDSGGKSPAKPVETQDNGGGDDAEILSANRTPRSETAGKATEGGSDGPAQDSGKVEKTAQTTAASPAAAKPAAPEKPYTDAASYMRYIRNNFDVAKVATAVKELWGATRADRNELLSADQIDELTKDKERALVKLKGNP